MIYNDNDEKKLNFQTHNDLQASHVIAIFAVFKKLSIVAKKKFQNEVFCI